jgi:signal transduction histidine kinase
MKAGLSLRTRVLIGAVLWTVGLFAVTGVVTTQFMFYYHPSSPRVLHDLFAHTRTVTFVALLCMIAGLFHVRSALTAINQLRTRLAAVHEGREPNVEGRYPVEVQPLVDDLNALLDHRGQAVSRAIAKAGDLAHGLKTPLALISQEADRALAGGQTDLASTLAEQVDRMRRQIDYHLAHARAAASSATLGARTLVAESAQALARTLLRLHAERGIAIHVEVPAEHAARCQREDLDEMLGNLLDNACKWGRKDIGVTSFHENDQIVLLIDDDGPGLAPENRRVVLQRGVRADQSAPGSGFGLAIVRDLAELYGGSIHLDASPAGGLRARLVLPAA